MYGMYMYRCENETYTCTDLLGRTKEHPDALNMHAYLEIGSDNVFITSTEGIEESCELLKRGWVGLVKYIITNTSYSTDEGKLEKK